MKVTRSGDSVTNTDGSTPDRRQAEGVHEGEVELPPEQPDVIVVWTVDEAKALPEGTVLTWTESDPVEPERHAAVIAQWDGKLFIRHTRQNYWQDDFDLIHFPALAFTWPINEAGGGRAVGIEARPSRPAVPTRLVQHT